MRSIPLSTALALTLATSFAAGCGGSTTIDPVARGSGPVADDGTKIVVLSSGAGGHAVAIDGDRAYFATDTDILVAPVTGGAAEVVAHGVNPVGSGAAGLAVDGASVFWPTDASGAAAIRSAPTSGGAVRDAAQGFTGTPLAVVADATDVYFTTTDGTIAKVAKSGGAISVVASDQGSPVALAVDDEGVYWATGGDATKPGSVRKVYKGQPSGVITLADGVGAVKGIAVDATCLYFTDTGDGTVRMVWKDGSHAVAMATAQLTPRGVVKQESTESLYWLTGSIKAVRQDIGTQATADGAIMGLIGEQGPPVRVVHQLLAPESIAAGDAAIVWSSGGSVYALPRAATK